MFYVSIAVIMVRSESSESLIEFMFLYAENWAHLQIAWNQTKPSCCGDLSFFPCPSGHYSYFTSTDNSDIIVLLIY